VREPVKGKTEAGRRREERARATRGHIVEAAGRLFLERGYVATTIEAIARAAGVAPATIYQAFGTKHAVLAATLDVTVAGDRAPVAVLEREWVADARAERDAQRRLRLVVEGAARIAARTAALKAVMRDAAATEPAVRELIREDHARRRRTQEAFVDLLVEHRPLRAGMDRERAVDVFFALVNSATYDLLTGPCGWTFDAWREWLVGLIEREFFGA
jgi:AcrR family transcriptional regulator